MKVLISDKASADLLSIYSYVEQRNPTAAHLIFYIVEHDSITIVRVLDGRMDIDEEFRR
jgi:plasmid stabilization system protein ParE